MYDVLLLLFCGKIGQKMEYGKKKSESALVSDVRAGDIIEVGGRA